MKTFEIRTIRTVTNIIKTIYEVKSESVDKAKTELKLADFLQRDGEKISEIDAEHLDEQINEDEHIIYAEERKS